MLLRHPSQYRLRLLEDLFRTLGLPVIILYSLLTLLEWRLGKLTFIAYPTLILIWASTRGSYESFRQRRAAQKLQASLIPQVVGKWPGNLDILLKMMSTIKTSYIQDAYLQLFKEHQSTTLNLRILWRDNIITMDQEHIKFLSATGFHHFWRGCAQKERLELFLGKGIFNRDDEAWKMHRNIARPFFARERFSDFDVFERHCSHTLSVLASHNNPTTPLDAQDLYGRFSLDAASEFLFGKSLDTLFGTLPIAGRSRLGPKGSLVEDSWGSFAQAFEMAQVNATIRGQIGSIWPLFELLKDKNEEHCKIIHEWLDPLVRSSLEQKRKRKMANIQSPISEKNFLEHLSESTDDSVLIRDQLLNMLLASRDTTSSTLTYITYFLALYPDVARRLRAEVLEQCGSRDAPTFEQLKSLKYMRAVINETLRLYPPVPLNIRETRESACALPPCDPTNFNRSSWYMPARTTIMYLPLLTHRNPSLWGEDADQFNPERWIEPSRVALFVSNPTMFTPFSAGPRVCLGQNYAYNQLSYFMVRLLQKYDRFTLAPEAQPAGSLPPASWKSGAGRQAEEKIWPAASMTLYVKGGLWIRYHRATS
ncbi:cytochrome P450 monooxygenase CYP63 [Crepidotus variabilis]|uniref:Cytochrome P450 monooxygenase CYP63 n=1 Tax=Crepidotus variabilis TaxID=179855 RepID=A0A9P6EL03_9AGAR|nr:cytochrome P450 monooxygenase CYP63 [Crepidotus variabilis]